MRIYIFLGLFFISCAFAQNATQCPTFECGPLPNGTCASVTANGIIVNEDGCPDQQGCSLEALIVDPNSVRNVTCVSLNTIAVQPSTRLLQTTNTTTVVTPVEADTSRNVTANITSTTATTSTDTTPTTNVTSPTFVNVTAVGVNATEPVDTTPTTNVTSPTFVNVTAVGVNATEPVPQSPTPTVNSTTTTITQTNTTAIGTNATSSAVNATSITTAPTFNCTTRTSQKNLESGSYPKECTSKDDCLLEDGTNNECVCGADGKQYCQPDVNSDVFDDFWELCDDEKMNTTLNDDWEIYAKYYVYIDSAPDCMENIFPELKTAVEAESYASEESSFGMWLGVSGLIWIVLLS
jgi:hypothetical protein